MFFSFKKLPIITSILFLSISSSYAQNKPNKDVYSNPIGPECSSVQWTNEQAMDITSITTTKEYSWLKQFLKHYCFTPNVYNTTSNTTDSPFFYARDLETIKYLMGTHVRPNFKTRNHTNLDILSFFLLMPFIDYSPSQIADIKKHLLTMKNKYNIPDFSSKTIEKITPEERSKIINFLISTYEKRDFYSKDKFSNGLTSYALISLEPQIFAQSFTIAPNLGLLQKNQDSLSVLHIAFLKKYSELSPEQQKINLSQINKIIADNVIERNLNVLMYEDLTFLDYMEIMKSNNMELYQILRPRFVGIPSKYNQMSPENRQKAFEYFNKFDYVKKHNEPIPTQNIVANPN